MKHRYVFLLALLLLPSTALAQDTVRLLSPPAVRTDAFAPIQAPLLLADTTIAYDSGIVAAITVDAQTRNEVYQLDAGSLQANRFVKPVGATLVSALVAPYYLNDFESTGVPDSLVRDFRLVIWDHASGAPASERMAFTITDDRANQANGEFIFLEVDTLQYFPDEMAALPDTFYIGLADAGEDVNALVMGVSEYADPTVDSVAFLYSPAFFEGSGGWRPFAGLSSETTGQTLAQRVLPIRAVFTRSDPTTAEDAGDVPERVTLYPNYPNPFNPSTTIAFDLPQAAHVRLSVFDLLGREVARLVDAPMAAGAHEVALEASRWASGLYLYRLEAAGQQLTRRMTLLK